MREQRKLIEEVPWNVLVVMDACRYDLLAERVGGVEQVASMANVTYRWCNNFKKKFPADPILWIVANPVVSRELSDRPNYTFIRVYEYKWGLHGPLYMPTCHPADVREAVFSYVADYGQPQRMVVWFLQPHAPYIGRDAIPYVTWGNSMKDPLSEAVMQHKSQGNGLKRSFQRGDVTADQLRAAYIGNLDVVLPNALKVFHTLDGVKVLTADHGEMLGEYGEVEHSCPPSFTELLTVPWLTTERSTDYTPSEINRGVDRRTEDTLVSAKLQALGYV